MLNYNIQQNMLQMSLKQLVLLCVVLQVNILCFNGESNGLKIGAFNVQLFGVKKMEKTAVVNVLVDIISRYDILLIQEIRDASGKAIEELLTITNQQNSKNPFSLKISPRLGRTTSKEQYAFLFRETSGLKVVRDYVYDDGDESLNTDTNTIDTFEREPYIVLFESSTTKLKRFALAGLHIAPSEAVKELQALEGVFADIKARFDINDIMVMGDFNAGCSYVPKYKWDTIPIKNNPLYTWWIGDDADTTVSNSDCPYDRFVSTGEGFRSTVINGSAIVFRFDSVFQLDQSFSKNVSDHYPIDLTLLHDSLTSAAYRSRIGVSLIFLWQCLLIYRGCLF